MPDPQDRSIVLHDLDIDSTRFQELLDQLGALVHEADLSLTSQQLELCLRHLLYVEQVNEYINLTRITDLTDALILHILDSLLLAPYVASPDGCLLDMGTGAGFPGIPLHIALGCPVTLLDSVGKKVKAVAAFRDALHLSDVLAVHDRIESFAIAHADDYDTVVARALAPLPILVEYAAPLLIAGGQLLISKGTPSSDELASGLAAAKLCGLSLEDSREFDLPRDMGHRSVMSFIKTHEASVSLPRAVGIARRNPLA